MSRHTGRLLLPYSAAQMFDLAADVERYPEFVDGWREARVVAEADGVRTVLQELGIGPLRWRFLSQARGERPHWLVIEASEAPFRRLHIRWDFRDHPPTGCAVDFSATAELRSARLQAMASMFLERSFQRTVDAFRQRARAMHGAR